MLTEDPKLETRLIMAPEAGAAARRGTPAPQGDGSLEPWIDLSGQEYGCCFEDEEGYHVCIYGVGTFDFAPEATEVSGAAEPGVTPGAFRDTFCREVLPYVLQRCSWEVLHASGLVVAGAGVALCGDSERGKSTLAAGWDRRGGAVYADDAIPFRVEGGRVPLQRIPFRIRPRPSALPSSGAAAEIPDRASGEARWAEGEEVGAAPDPAFLRAVYLLDRRPEGDGPVLFEPVSPAEAVFTLLNQAYCLTLRDRARNRRMVETYLALADAVPTFRLSYPTGLDHVDTILDQLTAHGGRHRIGADGDR
jgi:hypothetical protein